MVEATYCGNDDVHIFRLFHEELHLSLDELLRHLLRVTACTGTFFFDFDLEELGAEGLDLFSCGGPSVEASYDCA